MDEQQVDVVGLQLAQALVDACRRLLLSCIRNPYFRHQKNVLPDNTALAYGISYTFLVKVSLRRVNQAITHIQRIAYAPFTFLRSYLEHSVAQ